MRDSDFVRRIIAILTEAQGVHDILKADPSRGEEVLSGTMRSLLNEVLPTVTLPARATPEELSDSLSSQIGPVFERITGVFSMLFVSLAEIHDAGRIDVSSAQMLQDLALRADELWPDDDSE